jgi:hypothetical protein
MAAVSHATPDQAPAEVALLGVCGAVLIAVVAAVIRRGRARGWRHDRALQDVARSDRWAGTEPGVTMDGGNDGDTPRPRLAPGMLAAAAAVIIVAGGVGAAVVVLGSQHGAAGQRSAAADVNPVPGQAQAPVAPAGGPAPGKRPAKGADAAASPGGKGPGHGGSAGTSAGRGGSGSGSPGSQSTSTPASTAPPGTLSVPSTAHCIGVTTYSCSFTIAAVGGAVSYAVSAPGGGVSITNASGTLTAGQNALIRVNMTAASVVGYVTVSPGDATVTFTFPQPRPSPCEVKPPLQCP